MEFIVVGLGINCHAPPTAKISSNTEREKENNLTTRTRTYYLFITTRIKMASSLEAPRQFSQPSRKGKKAWRKNVDVTEVQEGLENVREEEIQG